MCKAQRRHILVGQSKFFQLVHDVDELFQNDIEGVGNHNNFRVTVDETARCAEVNDGHGAFRLRAVSLHVRHYVVAHLFFVLFRQIVIDIVGILFQFRHLFGRNVQSQLHFRLGKRDPELSPEFETLVVGKRALHFLTCISRDQRVIVNSIIRHIASPMYKNLRLYYNRSEKKTQQIALRFSLFFYPISCERPKDIF